MAITETEEFAAVRFITARKQGWDELERRLNAALFTIHSVEAFRVSELRMRRAGKFGAADRYRQLADAIEAGYVTEDSDHKVWALYFFFAESE